MIPHPDTPRLSPSAARTRASGGKDPGRQAQDFYRTPEASTRALLRVEALPRRVWEPACGDGAISRVLEAAGHGVLSTDRVERGYGEAGRDFLMERVPTDRAILTNPPFALADPFALHALRLGAPMVCLFMRLAWLEGIARAVAEFGHDVLAANPGASFTICVLMAEGRRKPRGFDAAGKAGTFGQDAFLREDVGEEATSRDLVAPPVRQQAPTQPDSGRVD